MLFDSDEDILDNIQLKSDEKETPKSIQLMNSDTKDTEHQSEPTEYY